MTYAEEQLDYYARKSEQIQQESKTAINHPDYYSSGGIEAIDFIDAHGLNFNRGNVIKYVTRAGRKDGEEELTALEKARYLDSYRKPLVSWHSDCSSNPFSRQRCS